jgi:hypothetical protein
MGCSSRFESPKTPPRIAGDQLRCNRARNAVRVDGQMIEQAVASASVKVSLQGALMVKRVPRASCVENHKQQQP